MRISNAEFEVVCIIVIYNDIQCTNVIYCCDKPPFLKNSLYKSAFAETKLYNKNGHISVAYKNKHLFFVHGSVGLTVVAVLLAVG